ncbi:uncharacterized protein LOC115995862 [Ipomoea triloba]|uniref:uncharacterized protein LOC115995862 n=1 Tax=Ipomoea triloba TaxID=35885 RepID=UPI00125D1A14|nr:uncharacterized protein LOC115995862 [Ipomoea triloba]
MAAFKLEGSTLKITSLNLGSTRPKLTTFGAVKSQSLVQYNGLLISSKPKKPLVGCRASISETQSKKSSDGNHKEVFSSPAVSQLIPYSREIQNLLTEFSDSESIAEFQIKIGEFELHVMRNLNGKSTPPPPITAPLTLAVSTAAEAPNSYTSISTKSLALGKPLVTPCEKDALLARAAEEGFVVIQSLRVGFFRRSRTVKGKSGPPSCKENQVVDEGQILCYVDQLGGEMPIEV